MPANLRNEREMSLMNTLIKNAWIVTMNDDYDIIRGGYAFVEGNKITEVGQDDARVRELEPTAQKVIDASDKILMPGMVNAHTHMFQTFMRGLADDKPLFQWLKEEIWPFSAMMTEEDFYYAGLIASLENLKSGATGVIDQHYIFTSLGNGDKVFESMRDSGIRGNLCRCFANIEYHENFREKDDVILDDIRRLQDTWGPSTPGPSRRTFSRQQRPSPRTLASSSRCTPPKPPPWWNAPQACTTACATLNFLRTWAFWTRTPRWRIRCGLTIMR